MCSGSEESVFKAHRLAYHSTPGSRVTQKKKAQLGQAEGNWAIFFFFFFITLDLEMSVTKIYEP